jgi:hypothetical protein
VLVTINGVDMPQLAPVFARINNRTQRGHLQLHFRATQGTECLQLRVSHAIWFGGKETRREGELRCTEWAG